MSLRYVKTIMQHLALSINEDKWLKSIVTKKKLSSWFPYKIQTQTNSFEWNCESNHRKLIQEFEF